MKLNKIFMALAAMAIVGCSSEDLSELAPQQAVEDSRLVELDPNFALAGVGVEGNVTRTHWEFSGTSLVNKFLPIWNTAPAGGNTIDKDADLLAQAVGLCWLGQGAVGTDVYTNYQFYHFGWLKKGETGAKFECGNFTNGAFYDEITVAAGDAAGDEANETKFTVPGKANPLNYNSGIYKTDNKAIFGGDYIVYYPFNEEFKNAGTIPAAAVTAFYPAPTDLKSPVLGHATFRYSNKVNIEGGAQASDFGLYNLSTLVQLRVAGPKGVVPGVNIDKIVLYSAKQQLLKQANLAADKIIEGKKGTELYAATEGLKTITATFGTPVAVDKTDGAPISAYITVLPTTVEDLVVLVHSTAGTWAKVNKPNTEFKAGNAVRLDIEVKAADFKADFIAVDEASLITARNEARLAGGGNVTVIGDITLTASSTYDFSSDLTNDPKITYKGDAIIVPEDVTLNTASNWQSDIRLLGKSCCTGTNGARLNISGGSLGNVTMEPTEDKNPKAAMNPIVTYSGDATIAEGTTFDAQAGSIVVNAAVSHKGNINIAKDVTLTVNAAGDLNFMGATVVNDGTIEVKKDGGFDMTDKEGNATATDGKRMTNNGKFIHNVDAGVGTAVQQMTQNGEYRCRVSKQEKLDDAFLTWTACSVIEITSASTYDLGPADAISYKHNGKFIDIEVNATGTTIFNNPIVSSGNGDSKIIQTGKLSVLKGGLVVDFVTGTGERELTVNGDMIVKANTTFTDSKKITITKNLKVEKGSASPTLTYEGAKANKEGLAVAKDIKLSNATFDAGAGTSASDVDALNITCANFSLEKGATAIIGNRTDGGTKNLVVTGTIDNAAGCTFNIEKANRVGSSVIGMVTCTKLIAAGTFTNSKPILVAE